MNCFGSSYITSEFLLEKARKRSFRGFLADICLCSSYITSVFLKMGRQFIHHLRFAHQYIQRLGLFSLVHTSLRSFAFCRRVVLSERLTLLEGLMLPVEPRCRYDTVAAGGRTADASPADRTLGLC
ncbi:MAG: hypothetical protein Q4B30_05040 [Coriobacteriaceae bacterium]|nr:hypothetical protein [Coriobacteriaceae bacterium]